MIGLLVRPTLHHSGMFPRLLVPLHSKPSQNRVDVMKFLDIGRPKRSTVSCNTIGLVRNHVPRSNHRGGELPSEQELTPGGDEQ
jgi:hypothetical protein